MKSLTPELMGSAWEFPAMYWSSRDNRNGFILNQRALWPRC